VSDVGADVLAEWSVVPENVIWLSVFAFGRRAGLVVEGVLISATSSAFWCGGAALSNEAWSNERAESRLLMLAGMFFVVIGGLLLSQFTYCNVVLGFV